MPNLIIQNNISQFFQSFFYLFVGILIFDCAFMLIKPLIYGYYYLSFWDWSLTNYPLNWILSILCIEVAVLTYDRKKSLWQSIINTKYKTASLSAVGLFNLIVLSMIAVIYLPDIIYDYKNDQCLSSFWYCFDFLK